MSAEAASCLPFPGCVSSQSNVLNTYWSRLQDRLSQEMFTGTKLLPYTRLSKGARPALHVHSSCSANAGTGLSTSNSAVVPKPSALQAESHLPLAHSVTQQPFECGVDLPDWLCGPAVHRLPHAGPDCVPYQPHHVLLGLHCQPGAGR